MPGPRQPTELVVANGRKHLTRAEEDQRRDQEVHVPVPDRAEPPRWLPKKLHAEFRQIGEILRLAGLYAELDRDALGQYFLARERWQRADKLAGKAIREQDEQKHTQYANLLYTYLMSECKPTDTARALHMHRNNVIYHVERLSEQLGVDLEDPETRLRLLLSFKVMDLMPL